VHYIGKLDLPDIRSCVRACDMFLLPSLWENMPYSCLEAMAAGRAIVASRQGGVPELIDHGRNGLLATCEDPDSFVGQLRILIEDESLRKRLGCAARKTVEEKFTDHEVARLSVMFYQEVLAARHAKGGRTQ
jgi:glycogen synthase